VWNAGGDASFVGKAMWALRDGLRESEREMGREGGREGR
jgi:hypothetical protein